MSSPRFLTTEEVAERYKVKPGAVRRMVRLGKIRAVNIGTDGRHIFRFAESDLVAFEEASAA